MLHFLPYHTGDIRITAAGKPLVSLPAGPINHHWTKNIIANPDGDTLYVTVGSNSNVGERGTAAEAGRASIWAIDLDTGSQRVFASGLRNPNGLAWNPSAARYGRLSTNATNSATTSFPII